MSNLHICSFFGGGDTVLPCTPELEWAISSRKLIKINFRLTFQNHLYSKNRVRQIAFSNGYENEEVAQFELREEF